MTINKFGKTVLSNINHNYSSLDKKLKFYEIEINRLQDEQKIFEKKFKESIEESIKIQTNYQNLEKDLTSEMSDFRTILNVSGQKLYDCETKLNSSSDKIKNIEKKCNNLKNSLDNLRELNKLKELIPNLDILNELIMQKIQERLDRTVK